MKKILRDLRVGKINTFEIYFLYFVKNTYI